MINLRPDVSGAMRKLQELERRQIPRVIGRTLDRTRKSTVSFTSKMLRQRINLPKSAVDGALKSRRSSEIQNLAALRYGRAWFEVRTTGKPFPLRDYQARMTKQGATFKVAKGGKRKLYEAKGNRGFIVQKLGGHVFVRSGPNPPGMKGAPIRKVYGPSLPQVFTTKRARDAVILHAQDYWAKDLTRNVQHAIRRAQLRS